MDFNRYSEITDKFPREILLLKGLPCAYGKCTFCDYTLDNETDINTINSVNKEVLKKVTGKYKRLEIINSGNVFELPKETIELIKQIVKDKDIEEIFFESHWIYRNRLENLRKQFDIPIIFKTGLETFDYNFRENILSKGFKTKDNLEIKKYFDSVCLLVGIKGQTKEMIRNDIKIASEIFEHFTVNLYINNSTSIKADPELQKWFYEEFNYLSDFKKCEVLWHNTDFGVG
ncbi:radical SAM protein [Mycoplasmatota bacterium WC44]